MLNFLCDRRQRQMCIRDSCMGSGDSDRVTGGICAGVLCGNESDYGGKFYGVYRIRWQSDTGKPVYL